MNDAKRAEIAQSILTMSAGVEFETAIAAQCDALATAIGGTFYLSGKSRAEAERLVRNLVKDITIRHVRRHWGTIEAAH